MYARSYDEGEVQSFRRGEYNIPANYRGNAFTADEPPIIEAEPPKSAANETQNISVEAAEPKCDDAHDVCECACKDCRESKQAPREGLLRGILSHFERGFEFDDLLLLGLAFLILQGSDDSKSRDEMILILAFLFLCGF